MTTQEARIILVEDDAMFSQMIHFQLSSVSNDFSSGNIQLVTSLAEFDEILSFFLPDVILLDLNLADSAGIDTYMKVKQKCPNAAVIILSGSDDEELSANIVQNGAQDYILKSDVNGRLLSKAIQYSLERMRQQIRLAESERKFRQVYESSPIPMLTVKGGSFVIQMTNKAFNDLYQCSAGYFYGKSFSELNCDQTEGFEIDTSLAKVQGQLCHKTLDGSEIHVELVANKLHTEGDTYICLIIDRTEELRFQEEKFKLVNAAQENEKHKIAREIHDGLAQNLVLMNLLFESFEFGPEQMEQKENFAAIIRSTIDEARGISYSLLPPELESGFLSGIQNMIHRLNFVKSYDFVINIEPSITEEDFNQVDRFNLFRILQEFINNSIKHSQSHLLNLDIKRDTTHRIHIQVRDNGIGFDRQKSSATLGITNMLNRLRLAHLEGDIHSRPGEGATLDVFITSNQLAAINKV
jgi:two-component system sensor histidine kinase UhpB